MNIQRLLEIMQAGLVDYWDVWFRPMPPQCQGNIKSSVNPSGSKTLKNNNKSPALTISNLTGAFAVLLFGLSISFLVFLCELIISISISNRHNRLLRNARDNSVKLAKMLETSPQSTLRWTETYENRENNALSRTVKICTDDEFLNQANHIHQNVRDSEAKMVTVDIHSH